MEGEIPVGPPRRANGLLFYQRRIPPSLLSRYNGKTHMLESLQTRDLSVARKRIAVLAHRDNQLWADMRRDPNLMSTAVDHDARTLIERWKLEVGKEPEWYEDRWFDQRQEKYRDDFYDIQTGNHSPERRDELIERLVTPAEREAFRLLKPQAKSEPRLSDALVVKIKRKSPTPRESFQSLARQSKGSKRLILSTRSWRLRPPISDAEGGHFRKIDMAPLANVRDFNRLGQGTMGSWVPGYPRMEA
jgi:hypothetical protein